MELITETYDIQVKVLLISEQHSSLLDALKAELQQMNVQVYVSIGGKEDYMKYDIIFFLNYPYVLPSEFIEHTDKKIIYIFNNYKNSHTPEEYSSFAD